MRTRSARVLRLSAALLSLTLVGPARAQAPANVGRQLGGQVQNNLSNAVLGQPAAVPGQPGAVLPGQTGAVVPGQPAGYVAPATPRQALQGVAGQVINNAASTITGQPGFMPSQSTSAVRYGLPPQYAASAPGSTVSYGGANYVVNADRTMSPATAAAQPAANAKRYGLPPQYAASAPGSTVSYGGANYVVNADRTMSPATAAVQPTADAAVRSAAVQPSPAASRYLIPAELAGSGPGRTVSYGGANYVINNDNTMSPTAR
ncbi:hypothetical protein V5E97_27535 [Singulisphaera sp. Ch08]|uniref:Uncharacterized protein n=1 Tax=Singulisphaera sp. Ch08 TaxID=3120278 RepID=A0AAU7C9T4_9BACT